MGLERAGFFPVFVSELNDDARLTYIRNRAHINPLLSEAQFNVGDIRKLTSDVGRLENLCSDLRSAYGIQEGELDLLVGGPPCQGFSGIGHRRSYSVDKVNLPSKLFHSRLGCAQGHQALGMLKDNGNLSFALIQVPLEQQAIACT